MSVFFANTGLPNTWQAFPRSASTPPRRRMRERDKRSRTNARAQALTEQRDATSARAQALTEQHDATGARAQALTEQHDATSTRAQALAHQRSRKRSRAFAPTGCAANDMASARAQCLERFQLPSITANARGQCLERPPLPRNAASIRAQCLESLALFARAVALRRAAGLSFFNSGFYKNVRQLQGFDALLLAGHMHFLVAVSIRTCDSCRDLTCPSGLPVAYQWLTSGLPVAYPVAYSPRLSFYI